MEASMGVRQGGGVSSQSISSGGSGVVFFVV